MSLIPTASPFFLPNVIEGMLGSFMPLNDDVTVSITMKGLH